MNKKRIWKNLMITLDMISAIRLMVSMLTKVSFTFSKHIYQINIQWEPGVLGALT